MGSGWLERRLSCTGRRQVKTVRKGREDTADEETEARFEHQNQQRLMRVWSLRESEDERKHMVSFHRFFLEQIRLTGFR